MANVEESDDDDEEDSISKKFKKRKRKGKSDSQKKLNKKNPWNVDSGSRYLFLYYCVLLTFNMDLLNLFKYYQSKLFLIKLFKYYIVHRKTI